jgi:transposase-like protein
MFRRTRGSCRCKYCDSINTVCNGKKYSKQRYLCRDCGKSFSESDDRIRRDPRERELCLLLYSHNMSMRSIQSTLNKFYSTNISFNLIALWIRSFSKQLSYDLAGKEKPRTIETLEIGEFYNYFYDLEKNKKNRSEYGLLLTEAEVKLLHLKY